MTTIPPADANASAQPDVRAYTIDAPNGEPIAIERRAPHGPAGGVVLIVPAMATRASYYAPIATWLATQGFVAYTFDYQGHGASARTHLRDVRADLFTWADDAATVARHVIDSEAPLPVTWLGHSLGAQILPFAPHEELDRALFIASGTGYWRHAEGPDSVLAPLLWYIVAPAATRLCGYYPGRRLKLLGDIPGPVMLQWINWCREPEYLVGAHPELAAMFDRVTLPITSLSFTDDTTMSDAATTQLESFYARAALTRLRLDPKQLHHAAVGHMGLFRRGNEALWRATILKCIGKTTASEPDI